MEPTAKRFGKYLRELRVAQGLSQQGLAERANLSVNAISSFERGERFPRGTTLDALVAALGPDIKQLLNENLLLAAEAEPPFYESLSAEKAARQILELLRGRPEPAIRLAVDVVRRIMEEFSIHEQNDSLPDNEADGRKAQK